jgi:hypothetical protein
MSAGVHGSTPVQVSAVAERQWTLPDDRKLQPEMQPGQ